MTVHLMSSQPAMEPHNLSQPGEYARLVQRFDERARRLRRQAAIFLVIIILVLGAGTAAFIFSNFIANLSLRPQTAETQYAATMKALQQRQDQLATIQSKIDQVRDSSEVRHPFEARLADAMVQFYRL